MVFSFANQKEIVNFASIFLLAIKDGNHTQPTL
jgi:hypothetical protein